MAVPRSRSRAGARPASALALIALFSAGGAAPHGRELPAGQAVDRGATSPAPRTAPDAAPRTTPDAASRAAPDAASRATPDNASRAAGPVNPRDPRLGPANPARGVPFPFDLYSHCGIEFARLGGEVWRAARPIREPLALPDADGITTYTAYTAGTMTLVDDELLRFVIDERRYEVSGSPVVVFRRTTVDPPLCA